jgi:trimeric autotransporter adhesin
VILYDWFHENENFPLKHSRKRSSCPFVLLLIPLTLACFALSPHARAVCQQGCLTNENTVLGDDALLNNTASDNTAIGAAALKSNTTGFQNTATGWVALFNNTTGTGNTATGATALLNNTTGNANTATGNGALSNNTTGFENTAIGDAALLSNTTGNHNMAAGSGALIDNTTGNDNTAIGRTALLSNRVGNDNTATGFSALVNNRAGNGNTATGVFALSGNTGGDNNTATGHNALLNNTTGSFNIALGAEAGGNLTTGSNNIDIANRGVAGEADTIGIGTRERHTNTFIAGINGVTVARGVGVIVDSNGHLGTVVSSERFKDEVKPMDKASEAILALKPVAFRYKHELDPEGIPQFGLVAEAVEKVNPALVARDADGKPFTVRYEAVNAMLLNEFLKEHRKNEEQQSKIEQQETKIAVQQKQIEALTAGLQKVSAQLELSKPASQTVLNNP